MVVALYVYMWSVNKKRDREAAISGSALTTEQEKEAIEKGMQVCTILYTLSVWHVSFRGDVLVYRINDTDITSSRPL